MPENEESQNTNSTSSENHSKAAMLASTGTQNLAQSCQASGFLHDTHPWWSSHWSVSGEMKSWILSPVGTLSYNDFHLQLAACFHGEELEDHLSL